MSVKTPYEQALKEADEKAEKARQAFRSIGKMTPRIEKLIDEADEAYKIVDRMLGRKV